MRLRLAILNKAVPIEERWALCEWLKKIYPDATIWVDYPDQIRSHYK